VAAVEVPADAFGDPRQTGRDRAGRLLPVPARQQRFTEADLLATARQQGIRSVSEIELAVLEADGKVSFFTATDSAEGAPDTGVSS
jgi:uncharacterized membrane protein YcaP (DUF421 family)